MGVTLRLLVAAACVVSLASEALGCCTRASWGVPGNGSYVLDTVHVELPDGETEVSVDIPHFGPLGCEVVGMDVAFCEAASLTFTGEFTVLIQLNENSPNTKGVLAGVGHCEPTTSTKSPSVLF